MIHKLYESLGGNRVMIPLAVVVWVVESCYFGAAAEETASFFQLINSL